MNYCPLCGSPAAEWPIFTSDYVRGYHLCEWHMRAAMRAAHVKEYNSIEHMAAKKYNRIAEEVTEVVEAIIEKYRSEESLFIDGYITEERGYRWCSMVNELDEKISTAIEHKGFGSPSKEYIKDDDVDRWLSNRLKILANDPDGRNHRCSGYRKDSADQRCKNRVRKDGEICSVCTKAGADSINIRQENGRLAAALYLLRTGNQMVTHAS